MQEYVFAKNVQSNNSSAKIANLKSKQTLQIDLVEPKTATVIQGDYVILDYGKEMNGGVRILARQANNVRIGIRFGESLTECCSELGGEKNATNLHNNAPH